MSSESRKIISTDELASIRERLREEGKTVVQCHGCFDIVHPGHLRYLRFAKDQGDVLMVSVTGDGEVGKGAERPYINEDLRADNLAALEVVDYVCIDDHDWAGPILEKLRPDIYVKGKEYETKSDDRFLREKHLVEEQGGTVIFSSGDVVYSSSYIIDRFRDRFSLERDQIQAFCRRHDITASTIRNLLKDFSGRRVLVIGDPILDRYIHCEALGIAAETPIVSVSPVKEDLYAGAGALIAQQISVLGADAGFLTVMGQGPDAELIRGHLDGASVSLHTVEEDSRPVFTKTRYLVDEKKVFKVDSGHASPLSTTATDRIIALLKDVLPQYDAIVVTDFGYGFFTPPVIEAITQSSRRQEIPYYVDVSSSRSSSILRFPAPRLATPTEQELRFSFADNESGLSHLASRYYAESSAEKLVLTIGKRGALIFDPPEKKGQRLRHDYLPSLSSLALDTIGAGDVFLASLSLSDLVGAPTPHGVYLGNVVAALHVAKLGNEPVDGTDIQAMIEHQQELSGQE